MVKGFFTDETLFSISIDRAWKAFIIDAHNLLPKLLPDIISHAEIIEGHGGIGSIYNFNFTEAVSDFRFVKYKILGLDGDGYRMEDIVVDGGFIGSRLKSYRFDQKFEEAGEGCTVVKLKVEYETWDETPFSVEEQKDLIQRFNGFRKAIEGYLNAHPTGYL